jgi:hypothetical protein
MPPKMMAAAQRDHRVDERAPDRPEPGDLPRLEPLRRASYQM